MQRNARGYSCGSARVENRFQADCMPDSLQTRASYAGVENDLSHLAVSETQTNTAPSVKSHLCVYAELWF